MKKIVYIIGDISLIGGREKIILEKAIFLSKQYNVTIISYNMEEKYLLKKYPMINFINLEYKNFFVNKKINRFRKKIYIYNLTKKIQKEIDKIKPNIVIGLCDYGMPAYLKLKILGSKILEIHGSYEYYDQGLEKLSFLKKINKKINFWRFKYILSKYDKVIILSNIDKDKWNLKNVEVIPNFYIKKQDIILENYFQEKRFLSAGRLSFEKGYDILIEVWKEVVKINNKIKIDIYGEGPEEEKIKFLIEKNKLEKNVYLKSFTNKLNEKYQNYYGYILPSRFECFPLVVLESISNGVPVIAFDLECGLKDMISSEKEGILIPRFDCKKMAKKIIKLYENEDLRNEISKNCLKKSEKFQDMKVMEKWVRLFENLI